MKKEKLMNDYLKENSDILKKYCDENNISYEKLICYPRSYNYSYIEFHLFKSHTRDKDWVLTETPVKKLLRIEKDENGALHFYPYFENLKKM